MELSIQKIAKIIFGGCSIHEYTLQKTKKQVRYSNKCIGYLFVDTSGKPFQSEMIPLLGSRDIQAKRSMAPEDNLD